MKIILDYLLSLVIRALLWIMGGLPMRVASNIGAAIAVGIGTRIGTSRKALENLNYIYPDMAAARKREIVRGVWDNLGRTFAEYPHLSRIPANDPRIRLVGGHHVENAIAAGRQIIFVAGHIGNWELIPHYWAKAGLPVTIIYRAANNRFVDAIIQQYREKSGQIFAAKGKAASKQLIATMNKGGHVVMLMDQRMSDGEVIDFLGKPALTATGWLRLVLKYRALIIPVYSVRDGAGGFIFGYDDPIDPQKIDLPGDPHAATRILALMVNNMYGRWIAKWPEQWLWLHKRWGKIQ